MAENAPVRFTVTTATALLVELRPLLERASDAARECMDPQRRLRLSQLTSDNSSSAAIRPLLEPAETLSRLMAEISDLGVVVRDPMSGLVDFPSQRDGEPIYICWRLGETSISHWHSSDSGFGGRQPL